MKTKVVGRTGARSRTRGNDWRHPGGSVSDRLYGVVRRLTAGLLLCCGLALTAAPAKLPMTVNDEDSATARWLDKPVLASHTLDDMEHADNWTHAGYGAMSFTSERAQDGVQSIRLVSPTQGDKPNREGGRPFGEASVTRNFKGDDWRDYNRLSFWVYPTVPGFKVVSLLVKLHNDGAVKVPDGYGREGLNYFLVKPDQWNHVVWEIPHLARDRVTGVSLIYRLQGHEPGATNTVCFDFDRLEMQKVRADHYEGWNVAPGKIAFSQSGYAAGSVKTAIASGLEATEFLLRRQDSGATVLRKPIRNVSTRLGTFQELDFSEARQPGLYVLQVSNVVTRPFPIRLQAWRDTAWKTLNFFYCERCGDAIPGIHDSCHEDWQANHQGNRISINGGWHDAGDLSQGCVNTAEAVHAMFELADSLLKFASGERPVASLAPPPPPRVQTTPLPERGEKTAQTPAKTEHWSGSKPAKTGKAPAPSPAKPALSEDELLADRLIEEAQWGLTWLRKTRFGDGYRVTWATMDYWTDNRLGTLDDTLGQVGNGAFENYLAAAAEAIAGRVLKSRLPDLASDYRQIAESDWQFARDKSPNPNLETAAAGLQASLELYRATGDKKFSDEAVRLADIVMSCQQRQYPDWQIPFTGFFYTRPQKDRILLYSHRGHEQAPTVGLAGLCQELPGHPNWMRWYSAVMLHSEYLKSMAKYTVPYGMIPAGIYKLEDSREAWFQEQVKQGIYLGDRYYLKLFPAWTSFRGNCGTGLSQTRAVSTAARLRRNLELTDLSQKQLQWVVGRNPFVQSIMYGEGWDFAPQYSAMSGDIVGSLPVGIQTRENRDVPYWPAANCYNYKEVWVHPATRWLSLVNDLDLPGTLTGSVTPKAWADVEIREARGGAPLIVKPDDSGRFQVQLPEGEYAVTHGEGRQSLTMLPGLRYEVNLNTPCNFQLDQVTARDGTVMIQVEAMGVGTHQFSLLADNLTIEAPAQIFNLISDKPTVFRWTGRIKAMNEPWVAVVIPDNALEKRREIFYARRLP